MLPTIRFTKEKIPKRRATREGTKAGPGPLKLPKDSSSEAIKMIPAKNNKKMLLI
jgi:hypothetical protein